MGLDQSGVQTVGTLIPKEGGHTVTAAVTALNYTLM